MISIIIPVYNVENYIEDCINSILQQEYQDWELLLIDNGSEDNSGDICMRLAKQEARIRFFYQQENRGVSAARNLGMEKARGEYITFVDADDWIKPDFLWVLWEMSQQTQADMAICGYERVCLKDRELLGKAKESAAAGQKSYYTEEYTRERYFGDYLLEGNTHCWGILYTRQLLEHLEFREDLSIGEDLLFLIDGAVKASKIIITDYRGYCYFVNTAGAMEKPFTPSYMDQITCWQEAEKKLTGRYPRLQRKVESIRLVSVLLVVGKLARLSKTEQRQYQKEQSYCHLLVKEYSREKEVFSYLPKGYSMKVRLYRYFPKVYISAYGRWKG
ncbi:MAG: glycosyltransferase family 2 protein [Lachnospiraceae bacterium]